MPGASLWLLRTKNGLFSFSEPILRLFLVPLLPSFASFYSMFTILPYLSFAPNVSLSCMSLIPLWWELSTLSSLPWYLSASLLSYKFFSISLLTGIMTFYSGSGIACDISSSPFVCFLSIDCLFPSFKADTALLTIVLNF